MWLSQRGALRAVLLRLHTRKHTPTTVHPHTLTHALAHTQKYVTFIAFPRQQWLCERASLLRCMYIASLVWKMKGQVFSKRKEILWDVG